MDDFRVMKPLRTITPALAIFLPGAALAPAAAFDMPSAAAAFEAAGETGAAGSYRLGLALELPAGWHTYWHDPGDAGIPPAFDFSMSANAAAVKVGYPAPVRLDDGVSVSMVYEHRVVFPLSVTAADPAAPVALRLHFAYGLCRDVCVPAEATLAMTLSPGEQADAAEAADLAAFAAQVPVPLEDDGGRLEILRAGYDPAEGAGELTVAVADDGDLRDLFATVAAPWYAVPPLPAGRDGDRRLFKVALEGPVGAKTLDGLAVTFTLAGEGRSWEIARRLE